MSLNEIILEEYGVEGGERSMDLSFAICEILLAVASMIRSCE